MGCTNCSGGGVRNRTGNNCPPNSVPINNTNCESCTPNECCTLLETIGVTCEELQATGLGRQVVTLDPNSCEPVLVPESEISGSGTVVQAANNVDQPSNPQSIVVTESPTNTFNVALNNYATRRLFWSSAVYRITATPTGSPSYFSFLVLPIWVNDSVSDVINPTPTVTTLWYAGGLSPADITDSPVFVLSNITNADIPFSYIGASVNTIGMPLLLEGEYFEGLFSAAVTTDIVRATGPSQVSSNLRGEVMVGIAAYGGNVYAGVPYYSFTEPLSTLAPSLRSLKQDVASNNTVPLGAEWFKNLLFSDINNPLNTAVTNELTFDVHVYIPL